MITIIIATKNKHDHITKCIESIVHSAYKNFEIIVLDQSINMKTCYLVRGISNIKIQYIRCLPIGKSHALNRGVTFARGNILAFTDDDCIVSPSWLNEILTAFRHYPHISAVFGRTKPFLPRKHQNSICPSTFTKPQTSLITKPCYHADNIGFGNNMAFRRKIFNKIGSFKPWLGPGSIGSNAEDAEFAIRTLTQGYKLLYEPRMVVYHNKWLTDKEMYQQNLSYAIGELACYTYYFVRGHKFAAGILKKNFFDSLYRLKQHLSPQSIHLLLSRLYGFFIGFIFGFFDLTLCMKV